MPAVDTKISALPLVQTLAGGERAPVVQAGATVAIETPMSVDNTGPAGKVGLGGAVSSTALIAETSLTSRDGWGSGGNPWLFDGLRTVDSNASSNPLNFGMRLWTTVPNTVTAAAREWTSLAIAEDFSGLCDMVAVTGQARKNANTNAMWAGQFNMIDYSDPTTATDNAIGIEVNIQGDLDDGNRHRNILYAVSHRVNFAAGWQSPIGTNRHFAGLHIATGTADLHYGIYINNPVGGIDEGIFFATTGTHAIHVNSGSAYSDSIVQIDGSVTAKNGIVIQATLSNSGSAAAFEVAGGSADYGLLVSATETLGWAGVSVQPDAQYAFLASGHYAVGALGINADEFIVLGTDTASSAAIKMKFNNTTRAVEFYRGAALKNSISMI